MPWPPRTNDPLPRAHTARSAREKWEHWILHEHGHGLDWQRVFGVGRWDGPRVWTAIRASLPSAPVTATRDLGARGVLCEVRIQLVIDGRTATVVTAWHFDRSGGDPRLVTAYPVT